MFWLGLGIGAIVGNTLGFIFLILCSVGSRGDDNGNN
jgi:hypothetical protein